MSKTTVRKGKQDDKFSLAIREVQGWAAENKKCFDCEQRGPTYVNITVGSFVCTKCSGMLRGMNPPHRIKSISMSTFTPEEVEFMRTRGNAWCSKIWLARWDPVNQPVDFKDDEKVKDFMVAKYEKRRFYSEANEKVVGTRSSPSISSLSSNSSQDNKPLASLIGSTIKAHMAQNHVVPPGSASSSVIPRSAPAAVPRPLDKLPQPPRPAQPPSFQQVSSAAPAASSTAAALTAVSLAATSSSQAVANSNSTPQQQSSDGFADFANFETAAFDSMPSDPMTAPPAFPADTLPPMKKISQGSLSGTVGSLAIQPPAGNKQEDRYSALKELDELFKSANIQSPAATDPAPISAGPAPEATTGAALFGSSQPLQPGGGGSKSNGLFSDITSDITGGAAAANFGRSSPAGWSTSSSSGAAAPWGSSATVAAWAGTSPGGAANNWTSNGGLGSAAATLPPPASSWGGSSTSTSAITSAQEADTLWAGTNGSVSAAAAASNSVGSSGGVGGGTGNSWAWNQQTGGGGGGGSSAPGTATLHPQPDIWGASPAANSTNPFGSSPSAGQPVNSTFNFSENNNDLFAAAPKPFNDKSGNPWSNVPVFTQNMTPAPNPNNPFL